MPARSQGDTLLLEPSVSPAVCARLLQGKADQVRVPANWREVHAVFWQHPTTLIAVSSLVWLVTSRLQTPVSLLDGVGARRAACQTLCGTSELSFSRGYESQLDAFAAPITRIVARTCCVTAGRGQVWHDCHACAAPCKHVSSAPASALQIKNATLAKRSPRAVQRSQLARACGLYRSGSFMPTSSTAPRTGSANAYTSTTTRSRTITSRWTAPRSQVLSSPQQSPFS